MLDVEVLSFSTLEKGGGNGGETVLGFMRPGCLESLVGEMYQDCQQQCQRYDDHRHHGGSANETLLVHDALTRTLTIPEPSSIPNPVKNPLTSEPK